MLHQADKTETDSKLRSHSFAHLKLTVNVLRHFTHNEEEIQRLTEVVMKFVPAVFAVELAMLHLIVQTQGSDQLYLLGLSVSVAALVLSCCQTCDRRDSLPLKVKHRQDLIKILGIWPCSQF